MKSKDIIMRLAVTALFCPLLAFAQQKSEPPEQRDMVRRREEWFYNQRAYPFKHIPAGARLRAFKQMDQMLADEAATPNLAQESGLDELSAPVSSARWTLIGPQPTNTPYSDPIVAGRVTALAVDPTDSNIVYAGAAEGGVWKTTDGGVHWIPLTDTQPSLAIGSIAIDPSNHSTIYVGTGEENFSADSYFGAGILKSVNGGSSWTQIKGPFVGQFNGIYFSGGAAHIGAIAIEPGNSSVMLVAVEMSSDTNNPDLTDVYRTDDGGQTWSSVLSDSSQSFKVGTAVLFDPSNGNIAYAAVDGPFSSCAGCISGVYKSLDAGKTWGRIDGTGNNVLPNTNLGRITLAISPSSSNTLYAGIEDTSTFGILGFFKTTDGGANWVKLVNTPDYCVPQCWYDQAVAVAPNDANVVFVGGRTTIYRSIDGGLHWTDVTTGADGFSLHADFHALAFSSDSSVIYAGNDGGVWSANPPTGTPMAWTELNDSLAITQFYFSASIAPNDLTNSFGGTQDNGAQKYSGTSVWNQVVCGDAGITSIDPLTPSNVYSVCQRGNGLVWKSTSGGNANSWSKAVNGINTGDGMGFLPPLAIDPLHPANLYFGTYRLYQTTNHARTWTAISGNLDSGFELTSIAVAPTDSNTVYVATSHGGVGVTTNALAGLGSVWKTSHVQPPLHYQPYITQIAVDPHTSTTAYVVVSGFNIGHVFRTVDGGLSWNDISGNLPNIPVNSIVIDPVLLNAFYVATDIGVFRTRNGGAKWSVLGKDLPSVVVLGLALHNSSRTLRAATHGRSMWDIHLPIADLATTVTESLNPVLHGNILSYTLVVTNNGPDIAASTSVSDAIPAGTTFVGYSTSAGTCTSPAVGATGTLKCKVGDLNSGATVTVSLTVKDSAPSGSKVTDRGSASSTTPDPNTKNNLATVKTTVN